MQKQYANLMASNKRFKSILENKENRKLKAENAKWPNLLRQVTVMVNVLGKEANKINVIISHKDPKQKDYTYDTPLTWAIKNGHTELVELLLKRKANPNYREYGRTKAPLGLAIDKGFKRIVKLLLEYGASDDYKGSSILNWTVKENDPSLVGLILQKMTKYDLEKINDALKIAQDSKNINPEIIALLNQVAQKKGMQLKREKFVESLIRDILKNNLNKIKRQLETKELDVNLQSKNELVPLHYAAYWHNVEAARLFIGYGANVNAQHKDGTTPLMMTMSLYSGLKKYLNEEGLEEIKPLAINTAKILIQNGADLNLKNKRGETALDIAKRLDFKEMVNLLENGMQKK